MTVPHTSVVDSTLPSRSLTVVIFPAEPATLLSVTDVVNGFPAAVPSELYAEVVMSSGAALVAGMSTFVTRPRES